MFLCWRAPGPLDSAVQMPLISCANCEECVGVGAACGSSAPTQGLCAPHRPQSGVCATSSFDATPPFPCASTALSSPNAPVSLSLMGPSFLYCGLHSHTYVSPLSAGRRGKRREAGTVLCCKVHARLMGITAIGGRAVMLPYPTCTPFMSTRTQDLL